MNVLILGAGGREYSIGLALSKDENVEKIYFAPGNGATDELGENLSISDFSELADFVEANGVDLTIVVKSVDSMAQHGRLIQKNTVCPGAFLLVNSGKRAMAMSGRV